MAKLLIKLYLISLTIRSWYSWWTLCQKIGLTMLPTGEGRANCQNPSINSPMCCLSLCCQLSYTLDYFKQTTTYKVRIWTGGRWWVWIVCKALKSHRCGSKLNPFTLLQDPFLVTRVSYFQSKSNFLNNLFCKWNYHIKLFSFCPCRTFKYLLCLWSIIRLWESSYANQCSGPINQRLVYKWPPWKEMKGLMTRQYNTQHWLVCE